VTGSRPSDVTLVFAAATDPGLKRAGNEDSYLAKPPVFIVADGMGGYEAGDRASAAVVAAFEQHVVGDGYPSLDDVRDALVTASAGVAEVAAETKRGAGSTVAGAILVEHENSPHWLVFNVGDSRVYRHDKGDLEQITIDHSLGQELIEKGELAREDLATFGERNVITRAIGAFDSTADSWLVPVITGERLLVCSDGLTGELVDEAIRATLTMSGKPEAAAAALVQRALQNGGRDNVTVIVIDVIAGGSEYSGEQTSGALRMSYEGADETTLPVTNGRAR
jgi:PPM family protein phosphatase